MHVIVFPEGVPVEIQVRTRLQHEWAELFEKMADLFGREIRYGDPVDTGLGPDADSAADAVVQFSIAVSQLMDTFERLEQLGHAGAELQADRQRIFHRLGQMQEMIQAFREVVERA